MFANINFLFAERTVCFPLEPVFDAHFVELVMSTLDGVTDVALKFLFLADVGVDVLTADDAFGQFDGLGSKRDLLVRVNGKLFLFLIFCD